MTADQNVLSFKRLRVSYSDRIHGNFLRLPSAVASVLDSSNVPIHELGILLQPGDCHVGWDGHESTKPSIDGIPVVEINPILAAEYGVAEGQFVDIHVTRYEESRVATEVHVEPLTSDDWEIISSHVAFFQDEILFQTRLVATGSRLLCYLDQIVGRFLVKKVVPNLGAARISADTELIIAPRENEARNLNKVDREASNSAYSPLFRRTGYAYAASGKFQGPVIELAPADAEYCSKSSLAYVTLIRNPLEPSTLPDMVATHIAAHVVIGEDRQDNRARLSRDLWDLLGVQRACGERIRVALLTDSVSDAAEAVLILHSVKGSHLLTASQAPEVARELQEWILTDRLWIPRWGAVIELRSSNGSRVPYGRCSDWRWAKKALEQPTLSQAISQASSRLQPTSSPPRELIGLESFVSDLVAALSAPSGIGPHCHFVHGRKGMGKTAILMHIAEVLQEKHHRYVAYIDCSTLLDTSNVAKMKQMLLKQLAIAYWRSPSVLLFDNADFLFPSSKQATGAPAPTVAQPATKLAQVLVSGLPDNTRVVLTSERLDGLVSLFNTKHFIGRTWALEPPSRTARCSILKALLKERGVDPEIAEGELTVDTDGYSPADLSGLVDKLFHEVLTKDISDAPPELPVAASKAAVTAALSSYTPISLRGIKLMRDTGVRWDSIGALHGPKRLLLETLEWPSKYAPVFAQCPLRLRSGILLYGFPGCGKTLLASAVAQQCGLNFISIKGPEILNKYIGASEQSVRELFEKAQAAKPCVLFFDEFDSIAPKRGHDSTGVTDRVVNQLLTQMDGAEGLDGVYVLAATSRPDLIDPALLRPGRLDKSVLCNMPDENERLEILAAIINSANMNVEPGLDLKTIAKKSVGYSGADLQAVCYNAHLNAVHRDLEQKQSSRAADKSPQTKEYILVNGITPRIPELKAVSAKSAVEPSDTETETNIGPLINAQDLKTAMDEARHSLSTTERKRLQAVYDQFINARDGNLPTGEADNEIGSRTSLM
ncbi:HFL271Cp [Eremothecium sinecaudum]|uniref:Peroxisomal ATPase PEX1 n=1 Tax=Eremothecium sinecaudum TaxID=45286 RepID=A0A120K2H9_9SACH|nr:HFL271Cp [Eremothecium sinecaudum]AMD21585.1 HFL271Cp [Eremothecium sinecaudum]